MNSNPHTASEYRLPNIGSMFALNTDLRIAFSIFVIVWIGFFIIGGGPVTNDEMGYMYLAWFDQTWYTHLNRYIHVYFLKFFMWLVDDPYKGAQLAWAFIVAACSGMIFLAVRSLTARQSYWPAILALLFFWGQSSIFRYVGVTYADYTLMLWVTAAAFVLIHRLSAPLEDRYLHSLLLGMLFVLAVKSKESGIILALPILSLAFTDKGLNLRSALVQWKWAFFGVAIIVAMMVVLDTIFLGDMFFSINPENLANTASYFVRSWERTRGNWLSYLLLSELSFPFVLYLLASLPIIQRGSIELRFLYFLPLVLILFLNTVMTVGAWNIIPRYFVPVLPTMMILASTYFYNSKQDWPGMKSLLPSYAILVVFIVVSISGVVAWKLVSSGSLVQFFGWTPYTFSLNIYYPLLILGVLTLYFFISDRRDLFFRRSIYALTIASLLPMFVAIPNNFTFSNRIYSVRTYPLDVFSKYMVVDKATRIMLTHALWKKNKMMEGSSSLLRLYFRVDIPDNNMLKSSEWVKEWSADYVIATEADLVTWKEQGRDVYSTVVHEPDRKVVLLCAPGKCKEILE